MKKLLKFGAILAVLLIVVVVGLTLFIRSYLTDDKIKELIIPQAEKHLGRDVEIGKIDVSIFKGITVHSFTLKEADGKTDFLRVDQFILRYDLSNLLQKKLSISEILLQKPVVRITRDKQGKFNYESLAILNKKEPKQATSREKTTDGKAKAVALPIALTLDGIQLKDAQITLRDDLKEIPDVDAQANLQVALDIGNDLSSLQYQGEMDFAANGVYGDVKPNIKGNLDFTTDTVGYDLHLQLDEEQADLNGKVTNLKKAPDILLNVTGKQLNIDKILALLGGLSQAGKNETKKAAKTPAPGAKKEGGLPPGLKAAGEIKVAKVLFQQLVLQDFHVNYKLDNGTLHIEDFGTNIAEGTLKGKAEIDMATPSIPIRSTIDVKGIALQNLLETLGKPVADTVLGHCDLHLNLAGPVADKKQKNPLASLSARGTALLDQVQYKKLLVEKINAPFSLSRGVMTVKDMTIGLAEGNIRSDMQINLLQKELPFSGKTKIQGLALQNLLAGLEKEVKDVTLGTMDTDMTFKGVAVPPTGKKITDNLEAKGNIRLDTITYKQLPVEKLHFPVTLTNGSLELKNYSAHTAGGQIKGDMRVNISKKELPFSGKTDLTQVVIQDLLTGLEKDIKNVSLGAVDGNMKYSGLAVPPTGKKITDNLQANGRIQLDKVIYKKLPVEKLQLPVDLKNGILQLTKFSANTADGHITGNARVNLQEQVPAYQGNISADSILIQKIFNGLEIPAAKMLEGKARTVLNFSGKGKKWEIMRNALNMKGTYGLENGRLGSIPITGAIAALFNLEELKDLSFKTLGGNIRLANGQLELKSSMKGSDVDFQTLGTIGLDGSLDLPITLIFSPQLTEKLKNQTSVAKYLTDSKGRAEMRLKLAGTVTKPYPTLDMSGLRKQATKKLQQKATEEVQKKLGEELNKLIPGLGGITTKKADKVPQTGQPLPNQSTPQQPKEPPPPPTLENTVEDAVDSAVQGVLKGLFGN